MRHLIFVGLFLVGCSPETQQAEHSAEVAKAISCQPETLSQEDTLTLSMATPHGSDLVAINPSNTYFWLARKGESMADVPENFGELSKLRLPAREASGLPAVYGEDEPRRFFENTGTYVFRMSENLETDDGTPSVECKVTYQAN